MPETSTFYTQAELAELFGVTYRTITNWRTAGKLPDPIAGIPALRWRREDIDDLLRSAS